MKEYSLGLYEKSMPNELDMRQKLFFARNAGYDYLEISIDESDEKLARLDFLKEDVCKLRGAIVDSGIPVRTMCLSGNRKYPIGSLDDAVRMRGKEIVFKAIEFAERIGIRIIQIAGYDEYYHPSNRQTEAYFTETLRECVRRATIHGVILAFETMETAFMDTVEKAMKYVHAVRSPYLQVYPDTGNIMNASIKYGSCVLNDLRQGSGHLAAIHLKESLPGVYREVRFGTGHVDFAACIQTALTMGARMYTLEFWDDGKGDWEREIKEARSYFEPFFEKATAS